ncbi:hypothetical protein [Eisenibacter elegans]|uniref:hypothetical protein n=1 Tax=Eisenibacter elegans TaxID=997 RepID=UPI00047B8BDF|nr:hypothetical protein [Eisenibacter elegans]
MNGITLNWKGLSTVLYQVAQEWAHSPAIDRHPTQVIEPEPEELIAHQSTTSDETQALAMQKLRITLADLEHISDALLHYSKHLRSQKTTQRQQQRLARVQRLDKKIYDLLDYYQIQQTEA